MSIGTQGTLVVEQVRFSSRQCDDTHSGCRWCRIIVVGRNWSGVVKIRMQAEVTHTGRVARDNSVVRSHTP